MNDLLASLLRALALPVLLLQAACAGPSSQAAPEARRHLLERIEDTAIVQLHADGFERLSLKDKVLCYHLCNAAVAGRDIFIDQKYGKALALRDLLEELYLHRQALAPDTAAEVERYLKLFWAHNGPHDHHSAEKRLLRLDAARFDAAVAAARAAGAELPAADRLAELFAILTAPGIDQVCTNKSPGEGHDPLAASCNNLYQGVTLADLEGFTERYPLNSRLVKQGDELIEQVYRAGDGEAIAPGLYAERIEQVIHHLEQAIPYANPATAKALRLLIRYYRTGEPEDWRQYNIAWVQDTDSVVDQINGFVEVYLDARGQKGAWEAVVSFELAEKTQAIEELAKDAQWFEDRMPWADEFKKKEVKGITARAIAVIIETGDSGPITPIGINLPNEADIRKDYGSKSVNLANVIEGYDESSAGSSIDEFAWDAAEVQRAKHWDKVDDIHTNLHEVVGHASGQVIMEMEPGADGGPSVARDPSAKLGTYYSTLEEARADLVGLYWIADPKLQELGILADPEGALAQYEAYCRNALVQLRRVKLGKKLEQDHMRNRQLVVHWIIHNSDAVEVAKRDGKTFYRVASIDAFRAAAGRLLAEVQRIKSTGDFKAGKELVDTYGTQVDRTLHAEVLGRLATLNLPSTTAFVQPELRLIHDHGGAIVDVEVYYPRDLADQMLRWSGKQE